MSENSPDDRSIIEAASLIPRIMAGMIGFIFAGIGLTVIGHLWTSTGFHAPPLFFRIFGSFIALAFVVIGGGTLLGAIWFKPKLSKLINQARSTSTVNQGPVNYTCTSCGAHLGEKVEVSPHGDVKCGYCGGWFNIHSSSRAAGN